MCLSVRWVLPRKLTNATANLVRQHDPALAARRTAFAFGKKDPTNTSDVLMDTSERHSLQTVFHFATSGLDTPETRRLLRRIHGRSHELGLETSGEPASVRDELET